MKSIPIPTPTVRICLAWAVFLAWAAAKAAFRAFAFLLLFILRFRLPSCGAADPTAPQLGYFTIFLRLCRMISSSGRPSTSTPLRAMDTSALV